MKILQLILLILIAFTACSPSGKHGKKNWMLPGEDVQRMVQTAFISAKPGDTLFFGEGKFNFTASLTFDGIDSVTFKGMGHDKTIFSFKNQTEGAEGVKVANVKNFTIEDIGLEDAKGDILKIDHSENVIIRRTRAEWTNGADSANGSYGLYPVSCKNVLMEDCVAKGASDAGIYVGQSENAIVRRNIAEGNVAGIEVENTDNAEVYENMVANNTAGIMIFDLPDLPKKNGRLVKIYKNKINGNNHPNFGKKGIAVYMVPSGTGLLLMACQQVEAFENEIMNNNTFGTAIIKLIGNEEIMQRQQRDSMFNRYPSSIYVHHNTYGREEGALPDTTRPFGKTMFETFGTKLPDIIYDGELNPALAFKGKLLTEHAVCIKNNGSATIFNMAAKSADAKAYDCELP